MNFKDGRRKKINEKRICKYCGREYLAKLQMSKYCSRLCGAKANIRNLRKGGGVPKEGCIKGGKWHKGKPKYQKFKKLQSKRMKEGGAIKARLACSSANTIIERIMETFLIQNNIPYEKEFILEGAAFDFKIGNLLIECDGNYWHNYPKGTKRDLEKNKIAERNGFNILRFWESQIKNNFGQVKKEVLQNVERIN